MEWKWIVVFLLVCNLILTILVMKKKNKSPYELYSSSSPTTIGPCGLGCITWLAKNKVCSQTDVENINKGLPITPECEFAIAACATSYCCSPFCAQKQTTCSGQPPPSDSNTSIQNVNAIYNLGYYFPI